MALQMACGSYTVMQTRRRVVMEPKEVTRYRNEVSIVNEQREVQCNRVVRETCYRDHTYTVRRPVREITYKTVNYTVRRPVRETKTKTVTYNVRRCVTENVQKEVTTYVRRPVTETYDRHGYTNRSRS